MTTSGLSCSAVGSLENIRGKFLFLSSDGRRGGSGAFRTNGSERRCRRGFHAKQRIGRENRQRFCLHFNLSFRHTAESWAELGVLKQAFIRTTTRKPEPTGVSECRSPQFVFRLDGQPCPRHDCSASILAWAACVNHGPRQPSRKPVWPTGRFIEVGTPSRPSRWLMLGQAVRGSSREETVSATSTSPKAPSWADRGI